MAGREKALADDGDGDTRKAHSTCSHPSYHTRQVGFTTGCPAKSRLSAGLDVPAAEGAPVAAEMFTAEISVPEVLISGRVLS